MEKFSTQQRAILATVLAVLFFIFYDYFFLAKYRANAEANATASQNATQISAPVSNSANAPVAIAPVQKIDPKTALVTIKAKDFVAIIDEKGQIASFELTDSVHKKDDETNANLVNLNSDLKPLQIRFADTKLNELAFNTPYTSNVGEVDLNNGKASIVLTQNLGDLVVSKSLEFYPNGKYDLKVNLSKKVEYFITPGARPDVVVDGYTVHGALLQKDDGNLEIVKDNKLRDDKFSQISVASAFDRYYANLFFNFDKKLDLVLAQGKDENIQIFAKANGDFATSGYMGPKNYNQLRDIDKRLDVVIEYGRFTFIAKPMFLFLNWLHGFTGNWGWAIVLMTIIIRFFLYPLTKRGMVSMNKLKDIAPKMKELQEKYKDNPDKLRVNMMELYKTSGANPMGGCLPILIQIPIFFSIYRVLLNAIELKGAPWILWIQDLALKDPWYVLPIFMGVLMYIQQKITPTNFTDPMQEKIMKMLPIVFTFVFMGFPAGLTLYWSVNNLASVVQQFFINKAFDKQKAEEKVEKVEKKDKKKAEK